MTLRPMVVSDAETLASWALDPVFCAHAGWKRRETADGAASWWRAAIAEPDAASIRLLAVRGEEPVGYVDLHGDESCVRELGFVIGPSSRWHQGVGTAAARAGLAYGFTVLDLSAIWVEAVEANTGSVRILRRIGMTETGFGDVETFLGDPSRYVQFRLSRADWSARNPEAGSSSGRAALRPGGS